MTRRLLLLQSILTMACADADRPAQGSESPLPAITTAIELRRLDPQLADRGCPVHVRGVVTLIDPGRTIFLQDQTGGMFARFKPEFPTVHPGAVVDVIGVSFSGLYFPGIVPQIIRV